MGTCSPPKHIHRHHIYLDHLADINHRFVCKTPLHKVMNSWGRTGVSSVKEGLHGQESGKKTRSGRASGRQAYPAFVLNLRCQFSEYDITFEVSKTIVEFKVCQNACLLGYHEVLFDSLDLCEVTLGDTETCILREDCVLLFQDWSKVLSFLNDVLEASWEQGLTAKQSAGELDLHLCFPWQCHHHVPSFPILACYILS